MKKTLLLITIVTSFSSANFDDFNFNYTRESLNKYDLYEGISEELSLSNTQKINMEIKYFDDTDLKKGLYYIYNSTIIINENTLPDYQKSLDSLKISSDNGNILAAYIGLNILRNNFLSKKNSIGMTYIRSFSRALARMDYTSGLFWYGKSYLSGWSVTSNYKKVQSIMKKVISKIEMIEEEDRTEHQQNILRQAQRDKALSAAMIYQEEHAGEPLKIKRKFKYIGETNDKK